MIDTYLLEQILAFFKEGTLSAAADDLLISQPALSQSMKKLEDLVGVPLFHRRKNKTTFNENGLLFVEYAQKIMDLQEEMLTTVRKQARQQSEFHLASTAPAPLRYIKESAKDHYPHLTIHTQLLTHEEELLQGLKADDFDLIISFHPIQEEELFCLSYLSEDLSMMVPTNHPLSHYHQLTFADLAGHNILLLSAIGFWQEIVKQQIPNGQFLYMDNDTAFEHLATVGSFPTFVSNLSNYQPIPDNRMIIPLTQKEAHTHYYLIGKKENTYKWQTLLDLIAKNESKHLPSHFAQS